MKRESLRHFECFKVESNEKYERTQYRFDKIFKIEKRGFIREGYHADLVIVNPSLPWSVKPDNILYKCGWSPFEGTEFPYSIQSTFVNGHLVYHQGQFNEAQKGSRMQFTRS